MPDYQITPRVEFIQLLTYDRPQAAAWVRGNADHPGLSGLVKFYQTSYGGILVEAEIFGLPNIDTRGSSDFYAMHIHENGDCTQDQHHRFFRTGDHYNPSGEPHPNHAGDLPPLLGNQGYAFSVFYDKRFTMSDIIGKSVVIHACTDDFMTQPSGNAGDKIGCGDIRRTI